MTDGTEGARERSADTICGRNGNGRRLQHGSENGADRMEKAPFPNYGIKFKYGYKSKRMTQRHGWRGISSGDVSGLCPLAP